MKTIILIFSTALILFLSACKTPPTYTVTKLSVKPDSLYNEEANLFLGKQITVEEQGKAIKIQIGTDNPLFLQYKGQNNNYEKTNNPLDYHRNYSTQINGVYYDLSSMKAKDGSSFLMLTLSHKNKHPTDTTHYNTNGSGVASALMESERNQVHMNLTANAK